MNSNTKQPEVEQKKTLIKPAIDDNAFEALEKEFDEVINELEGNRGLDKFKDEYEKLMRALMKSHDNEKRLMRKCRELKAEIVSNTAKVSQAVKLSSDDPANMAALKREIEKAWKIVDVAADKETKARETIDRLKGEIAHLSKLVEQGGASTGVDSLAEMTRLKEKLIKERDEQQEENRRLREQIEETRNRTANLQNEILESQNKISDLNQEMQAKNTEAQRELRRKERMERELKQVRAEVEAKMEEIRVTSAAVDKLKQELRQKEEDNRSTKVSLEQANRQLQVTETKLKESQAKLEQQIQITDSVMVENQSRLSEVKQREDEVNNLKIECNKIMKQREAAQKKLRQSEEEKTSLEALRDRLRSEVQAYDNEIELMKKSQEADRRACDELAKEREQLNKNLTRAVAQTNKQTNLLKMHELSKQNLEQEIVNYRDEAQKQRKIIYKLERERDRYITDASELTQRVLQNMDELKYREMQIFENKKRIAEAETKLKQQQNLYEAVRSDRNLYSKNLIEAQDDIAEMKRKLKILSHQIDQLKDDIATKEATLVKENLDRQRVEKEKEQLTKELQRMRVQATENRAYIEAQEAEESKLLKIVAEAEQERLKEKKEHEQVISERDILGSQLVRRNDELALLYEKIRIQQSILSKGERQYNQRLRDLNLLKQEVRKLRREKAVLQCTASKVEDLKTEVHRVQRELVRERTRAKALEEELQNPVNVHRWRKLEVRFNCNGQLNNQCMNNSNTLYPMDRSTTLTVGANSVCYQSKTEEVVEKELLIQEKEKLYVELKHILARQPGPEVAEQLNIYQMMIKEKTKQIKSMAAEMNLYENQIVQYKGELDILNRELQDLKKKYFSQKKRQMDPDLFENSNVNKSKALKPQRDNDGQAKFTGGGFKLTKVLA
ncbi:cilia- and flagella-associated protein 58 [Paragonimus skrjabini miyazakii]|uniref:Cilia- and flagella-associated protein 58 n=1 Tax=Paragonimus skrjabini miyazakii TaxID=59628 RepID=A0A8S9YFM3_9TREM|nr:cilia- and flagella-associated protein 58 [Paragonimus skrjabini miyazakii]